VTKLTSVDGIDLTYRTAGETGLPAVLLLHSLGKNSSDGNAVAEAYQFRSGDVVSTEAESCQNDYESDEERCLIRSRAS
jgi:hypothetical protein